MFQVLCRSFLTVVHHIQFYRFFLRQAESLSHLTSAANAVFVPEHLFGLGNIDEGVQVAFRTRCTTQRTIEAHRPGLLERTFQPRIRVATVDVLACQIVFARKHVTESNGKERVAVWRDEPIASVDLLNMKEASRLALVAVVPPYLSSSAAASVPVNCGSTRLVSNRQMILKREDCMKNSGQ